MADVLILPGLGDGAFTWGPVTRHPGRYTFLERLDGTTWNLRAETARVAEAVARLDRPVLVGHSMGALYAEAYARLHPGRVAGLVLSDPSFEDAHRPGVRGPVPPWAAWLAAPALAWRLGPPVWTLGTLTASRRAPDRAVLRAGRLRYRDPRAFRAALAEWFAYPEVTSDLAGLRASTVPPDVPTVVLSATSGAVPPVGHVRLAGLFPRGELWRVRRSGHLVHLDRPDAVLAAIAAVEE
ncbi:alpha/beta hydrolase [Actinorhabdospora filicis]|uniref:Alpha/beta hydrolase n=1 Tax=Actinorhabdospora filicis TaxID=1785913 RepID=A0A9W6SGG1_9ACTN|nr:alpha/beta hydrolase [Actinorhabdospora filicis]GLZ75553.1 alpha/beta hydrolase [Actinorhabdospora filicis]